MSNLQKRLSHKDLNSLAPMEISENEIVQDKFIDMYNKIHGTEHGEMVYYKETFNFKKLIMENEALAQCTPLSLYSVFLDIAMNGLSLEQGSKPLAYIIPRNANVGTRERPLWEKRAYLVVSPYGELVMRVRAGQIKHADNPVIVYSCDKFSVFIDESGNKRINYEGKIPRDPDSTVIAAFIKLVRGDGSIDYEYLTMDDVERLKDYSTKNNRGKTNPLYSSNKGSIDIGFLAGKMIKHAFRSYPKVKVSGIATITETEIDHSKIADYGVEIKKPVEIIDGEVQEETQEEMQEEMQEEIEEENELYTDDDVTF